MHQNSPVGAHGERRADGFPAQLDPQGDDDEFARRAGFAQAHAFLYGNLVERVHGHLDVRRLDAGIVRLDTDFDVEIDNPLDGDENFHVEPATGRDGVASPGTEQSLERAC